MNRLTTTIGLWCLFLFKMGFGQSADSVRYSGIKFLQNMSWQEIREKAMRGHKSIFVDCYATWCTPCRWMEKEVYNRPAIGDYFNQRFLSVKVQMDTTIHDAETVKTWYNAASALQKEFRVTAYPTFLFFSPDGTLVHRHEGAINDTGFLKVAAQSLDPAAQYYTLLQGYKRGIRNYSSMRALATEANNFEGHDMAKGIAEDYLYSYLYKRPPAEILQKDILLFLDLFPDLVVKDGSRGILFRLFYRHPGLVDSTVAINGFAGHYVSFIIGKEEIDDKLWLNDKLLTRAPDWKALYTKVKIKYGHKWADKLIDDHRLAFYKRVKNWQTYAILRDRKIQRDPPKKGEGIASDQWRLNEDAWDVFESCDDPKVLQKALKWIDLSIRLDQPSPNPQILDTKANLLYKLGKNGEAITYEEQAKTAIFSLNHDREDPLYRTYDSTIMTMKNGGKTWQE